MITVGQGAILWVHNFETMKHFYLETLQLQLVEGQDFEGWVQFALGDGTFSLHAIPAEYAVNNDLDEPAHPQWDSAVKCVFYVEDFETSVKALIEKNVRLVQDEFIRYGYADFMDPEGNVFQIAIKTAGSNP